MLQCVGHVKLPATPKQVVLHHHTQGGVAITAVAFARAGAPNFFTVTELPTPNTDGAPMRVVHVRAPGQVVSRLAVGRSADGTDVLVVAQCCTVRAEDGATTAADVHLFRREAAGDEADSDAYGAATEAVRYRRLPRPVSGFATGADGERAQSPVPVWTAALALNSAENAVDYATGSSLTSSPRPPRSAMRVVAAAGGGLSGQPVCLQVLSIEGTRGALDFTVEVPALSGFAVEEIVSVPGCVDRLILRCHHALVEVDLGICHSLLSMQQQQQQQPPQLRTNEAVTRVWRWTPRDRLTGVSLKDGRVYATTEEGVVLLWDYQQASSGASPAGQALHPLCHSTATGVAHTGIHAPYATDFVTCGVDGSVLTWGYSQLQDHLEAGVVGLSALSDFAQAAADAAVENKFPFTPFPADGDQAVPYLPQTLLRAYALDGRGATVVTDSTGAKRYNGGNTATTAARAGRVARTDAARQATLQLGRQLTETRPLIGTAGESCIGLSGDGNLVSVVGDLNVLRLYMCQ